MFNGANLIPTRTVITVREILIPGAIIGQNDKKKSLTAHGNPPFDILAHRRHVRVLPGSNRNSVSPCITSQLPSIPNLHPPEASQPTIEDPLSDLVSLAEDLDAADDGDEIADPSRTQTTRNSDPGSAAEGASVLGEIPFAVLTTYALLIEAYLKTKNVTWQDMLRFHPKWLWRHCRRTIPPPEDLYPLEFEHPTCCAEYTCAPTTKTPSNSRWYWCQNACQDRSEKSLVLCVGRKSTARDQRRCVAAKDVELEKPARIHLGLEKAQGQTLLTFTN
ncbi:hypothetical protein C8R45DRAFT_932335 [Mycena sanguinolenta]|nr:hypothetical protein C8R45DRAFT_932335 [Mycena sanguinolenta]